MQRPLPSLGRTGLMLAALALSDIASAAIETQKVPQQETPTPEPEPVLTKAPELLRFVSAVYPQEQLAQGVAGDVRMLIDIDAEGAVDRVEVVEASHPAFREPAMLAALQFEFSPAHVNDVPSPIRIEYRYVFTPEAPEPDVIAGLPIELDANQAVLNFTGQVLEAGVRSPVRGAIISIDDLPVAETDVQGMFQVRGVPVGTFKVKVTSPYHSTYIVDEELGFDERLEVRYYVTRQSYDPYETVVRTKLERREASKVTLERRELTKQPGTFGDPIKVIENLPGMARTPGGLGGALLVRGANPQDSQVFIDGVPVPFLYHFGGLTSVVNANMLDRIDFYPGGFNARYGGAIAGVVDVITRQADCDGFHGQVEPSALELEAFTCLHRDDEWTLSFAGRRSVVDTYLQGVLDIIPRGEDQGLLTVVPVYADYQLKAEGNFGPHRLDVFFFGSDDALRLVQSGSNENVNFNVRTHQGFHRVLLRHRWQLTKDLNFTTTVSPGFVFSQFAVAAEELGAESTFNLDIWAVNVREDVTWEVFDWLTLRSGFDGSFGRSRLFIDFPVPTQVGAFPSPTFDFTRSEQFSTDLVVNNHAYYLEAQVEPLQNLKLVSGLRLERWDFHKTQDFSVMPRFNARWEFLEGMTAKAAYGLFEKLPEPQDILQRPTGNPKLRPLQAHHFILGYEHAFTDLINLDVQTYYIRRERIPARSSNVFFRNGRQIEEVLTNSGGGDTVGVEILLRHLATQPAPWDGTFESLLRGRFYGWIAYTLSQALRYDRAPGSSYVIEQGNGLTQTFDYSTRSTQPYLAPFDQTHILTVVGQMILPAGFEAGFRFRLVSGNPFTPSDQGTIFVDVDRDSYAADLTNVPRSSGRLPLFHQLDIRVDWTTTFDLWQLTVFAELINVYAQQNTEQIQYAYDYSTTANLSLLPFLPVIGVSATW